MGRIIANKVKGMSLVGKISLVLIFTLLFLVAVKPGWYSPSQSQAVGIGQSWKTLASWNTQWTTTAWVTMNTSIPSVAGTNRLLVVGISSSGKGTLWTSVMSISLGGVALTPATNNTAAGMQPHTFIYYLKENAVMDTWSTLRVRLNSNTTHYGTDIQYGVYTGVDQTTPVGTAQSRWFTSGGSWTTLSLTNWLTLNSGDTAVKVVNSWRSFRAPRTITTWGTPALWSTNSRAVKSWATGMNSAAGQRKISTASESDSAAVTFSAAPTHASLSAIVIKAMADVTPPVPGTVNLSIGNATHVPAAFTMTTTFADAESSITGCDYATTGTNWAAATWNAGTCTQAVSGLTNGTAQTLNMRATSTGGTAAATALSRTTDAVAPSTSASALGGTYTFGTYTNVSPLTVTLTGSDTGGSGVSGTQYCVDTLNSCTPGTAGTSVDVTCATESCTQYVRYRSTDVVTNLETTTSSQVLQDVIAPTVPTPSTPADEALDLPLNQSVAITASTDGGSGGVQYYYDFVDTDAYTHNSGWIGGLTYAPTALQYGTTYTWKVKARDAAGNESAYTTPRSFTTIQECFRNEPSIDFSGGSIQTVTTDAGTANYTVVLKNNDIGGCTTTIFTLSTSETLDDGDNFVDIAQLGGANPPFNSNALAPGATQNITLGVTARAGKTLGRAKNKVTSAADGNHPSITSAATTTNLNVATCTKNAPQLSIGPDAGNVAKGGMIAYSVSVKNMDVGAACVAEDFTVSIVSENPATPNANFNKSTLNYPTLDVLSVIKTLNPGQTGTATLTVITPANTTLETINVTTIGVTAAGHDSPANATATTTVGNKNIHNSINTNSTKWSSVGGWGVPGGKYGEFICNTCHNISGSTNNIKKVLDKIATPDNSKGALPGDWKTIVFTKTAGNAGDAGVMADDSDAPRSASNRICEICHTYSSSGVDGVRVHAYNQAAYNLDTDGTTWTTSNHKNFNAKDCIVCHKHNFGFMPPAEGCAACHGYPPTDITLADISGKTTGSVTAGKHARHTAAPISYACSFCHTGYNMPEDSVVTSGYNVSLGFNYLSWTTGSYGGQTGVSYTVGGSAQAVGNGSKQCSNMYCHSNGNLADDSGTGALVAAGGLSWRTVVWDAAAWTTASRCSQCHGDQAGKAHPVYTSGTAGSTTANSHVKHVESSLLSCDYCHNATTTDTAIPPTDVIGGGGGLHINRVENVDFKSNGGKWGSYAAASKTCSATYCHGTGVSPAWGTTANCAACHDATGTALSLRHDKHYNSAAIPTVLAGASDAHTTTNFVYACLQCHPTATHTTGPWNSLADAQLNGAKMTWYTVGATYTTDAKGYKYSVTGTCGTVCHTKDGVTVGSATQAFNWATVTTGGGTCGICHNKAGDGSPTWTAAHTKHVNAYSANSNLNCNACHSSTAASNTALQATTAARNQHPDGTKNVAFNGWSSGAGAVWNGTTCSNTYCHSAGTSANAGTHGALTWTTTQGCTACHATTALSTGVHSVHVNDTNNQVGFSITCDECHSATASNNTTVTGFAYHVDKNVNVRFNNTTRNLDADAPTYNGNPATSVTAGGSSKAPGSASGNCNNVYCHSSGNIGSITFSNISWSTAIGCGGCHGDTVTKKAHPVYASGAAGSATANSHVKHVEGSLLGCDMCHLNTVSTSWITFTAATQVVPAGSHLNRVENVDFKENGGKWGSYASGSRTCSATYCHGSAVSPAWGTTANCGSCHDATGSTLSLTHSKHYNSAAIPTQLAGATDAHTTTNFVYACLQCHPTATHTTGPWNSMADAQISSAKMTWYTVGAANTTDAKGYKYSVTGTCGTVCHTKDGVTAGSAIQAFNWATVTTGGGTCGICHNKAGDGTPTWTTAHTKHVNTYSANANLTCYACHSGTAATNTALQATTAARNQHPNVTKNIEMNAWSSMASNTWAAGTSQCTNTYCHSAGTSATAGTHAAISWNSIGATTCASCHGGPGTWTTAAGPGAHHKHVVSNSYACNVCHNATASNNTTITGFAEHVDKSATIQIGNTWSSVAGVTYNGQPAAWNTIYRKTVGTAAGTCNNTSCHGGTSVAWSTINPDALCVKCHGITGQTPAQYAADNRVAAPGFNGTGINTWNSVGTLTNGVSGNAKVGAHNKHLQAYSVWATIGYSNDVKCNDCHTPYTAVTDAGHMNGSTDFTWTSLARNEGTDYQAVSGILSPTYSGGACSNVYCHGNAFATGNRGNNRTPGWTSNAYITTIPQVADAGACGRCHISPPPFKKDGVTAHPGATLGPGNCNSCHTHTGWGTNHIDGKLQAAGGGCNGCHWYDTTDAGAWTTTNGIGGGTGLWMSTNAFGAHAKHINHLKARYGATLDAATDQWTTSGGAGGYGKVCGFCHGTEKTADHGADGGLASRQLWLTTSARTTHQFGASAVSWGTVGASRTCSNIDCHYKASPTW